MIGPLWNSNLALKNDDGFLKTKIKMDPALLDALEWKLPEHDPKSCYVHPSICQKAISLRENIEYKLQIPDEKMNVGSWQSKIDPK